MKNKPVCYEPNRFIPEIYSGVPTFMGLPKVEYKDLRDVDICIMGVPFEGICTYGGFSGAEMATKSIRTASVRYGGFLPEYDLDIFDHLSGGDYGDSAMLNGDFEFSLRTARKKFKEILEARALPIIFGGDHSISYPLIEEFAKHHRGRVGVLHFDAHLDNCKSYGDELYARCSPFYRLYECGALNPHNIVHFGIRGPRNHFSGLKNAQQFGASVFTMMKIRELGTKEAIKQALEVALKDVDTLYVSVCSDFLDISANPAGPLDPCGFTSFELCSMLHECGLAGASAFDFVEVYPSRDPNNVSSHLAAWAAIYFLSGVTKKRLDGLK